jgi:hypothetical protein
MKTYPAPWGRPLVVISSLATVLLAGTTLFLARSDRDMFSLVAWLPLALVGGTALFTIRGYTVTADAVLVRRLFWVTRVPLAGLESARHEPDVMRGSLRTFGNGGLFSFTGYYRNERLGAYRALVTDFQRTVVLRFTDRTLVLSPDTPEEFVREVLEFTDRDRSKIRLDT